MKYDDNIRVNKYLGELGYCSRREADKLVEQGRVTINNNVAKKGEKVKPGDNVMVDGESISKPKKRPVYIAFNKPKGIVCTTDTDKEKDNIIDYINYPKRIFPIGRLDKLSEGLIFLTNDGDIVNKILRAGNNHEKEYYVSVRQDITHEFIQSMRNGVPVAGQVTQKCFVQAKGKRNFTIILTQGLNRQIRRMCEHLGYEVARLTRRRIMNIALDVPVGKWRYLSDKEIDELNEMVSGSLKTQKPKKSKGRKNDKSGSAIKGESKSKGVKANVPGNKNKSQNRREVGEKGARGSAKFSKGTAQGKRSGSDKSKNRFN